MRPGVIRPSVLAPGADDEVAADQRVGFADGDADRGDVVGALGDAAVDVDRPALLREAGHLHHARALAVEMGGHGEDRADGDDAGAADAGDDDVVGAVDRGQRRVRAGRQMSSAAVADLRIFAPSSVTKDGQKPLRQEKSLLQEDWSMARLRPNSVSTGTIETQFDCTPQSPQPSQTSVLMNTRWSGSGKLAALAAAALFGGAGLDVDDGRDARDLCGILCWTASSSSRGVHAVPRREGRSRSTSSFGS